MTRSITALSIAAAAALAPVAAEAQQDYPSRPIRFIVCYPPGGSTTYTARLVGQRLTEAWGQQVVIDNRPGGNTIIGTQAAVRARPDGYTILLMGSTMAANHLLLKTPYDGPKEITPVATVAGHENVLVVYPGLAATTLQEFVALARAKPGQINFGTSSAGGSTHFGAELFNLAAGIRTQHIPYKGGSPALTDVMGGQVQFMVAVPVNVVGHVKSARLRALAVSGETRLPAFPAVPTFTESGVPGVSLNTWQGVGIPTGTPKAIIDRMSAEIGKLIALPETKEQLNSQGFDAFYNNPEQSAAVMREELAKYARIIKEAGIKPL